MATEKTRFDDWLKDNLWRDLFFRAFAWTSVAALSAYFTLSVDAVSANDYLKNQSNSVFRLANLIGALAVFLGLIAMMFKDLECANPHLWGRDTKLGGIGGLFRRLAGDLTLWTLGALVSVLIAVAVFGFNATGSPAEWAIFSLFYLLLVGMSFAVACINVFVRRAETFVAPTIANSKIIFLLYSIVIIGCPIYLYLTNK